MGSRVKLSTLPDCLKQMPKLSWLLIESNNFTNFLEEIPKLKKLKRIYFDKHNLSDEEIKIIKQELGKKIFFMDALRK